MGKYTVETFIERQLNGQVFVKLTKSEDMKFGKGSHRIYTPYEVVREPINNLTFFPIENTFKFLHYGNLLTIIRFDKGDTEILGANIVDNHMNQGCFDTNMYRVGEIMSMSEYETYAYIFSHIKDHECFRNSLINNEGLATNYLDEYAQNGLIKKEGKEYFHIVAGNYLQSSTIPENLVVVLEEYYKYPVLLDILVHEHNKGVEFYLRDEYYHNFYKVCVDDYNNVVNSVLNRQFNTKKLCIESEYQDMLINDIKKYKRNGYVFREGMLYNIRKRQLRRWIGNLSSL